MITLNKKGQWYRFFDNFQVYPSNLCQLFWSGLMYPLASVFIGVLGFLFIAYSLLGWGHVIALFFGVPWPFFVSKSVAGINILIAFEALGLVIWFFVSVASAARGTNTAAVAGEAYRGFKDKYCPLVEWE